MAGRQQLHAFEARDRPRQGGEREDVVDAAQVGPGGTMPEASSAFDFRGEQQPVALPRPVERADAEAVAPENAVAALAIPQGDGELPAQPCRTFLPDALPTGAE